MRQPPGRLRRRIIAAATIVSVIAGTLVGVGGASPANASATVAVVAGTGYSGYNTPDTQTGTSAKLWGPTGLASDGRGNIFFADRSNHIVRKLDSGGTISTFYGTPGVGYLVSSGGLNNPMGVAVAASDTAAAGTVYISDTLNGVVWAVSSSGATVVAGGTSGLGFAGDGGSATASGVKLNQATSLAYDDATSTLYIADGYNCRIRAVAAGIITTVAGSGTCGYGGDGGAATSASLGSSTSVAVRNGVLYIADGNNSRIRAVDLTAGTISTVAGTGSYGDYGDGGMATSAGVQAPKGIDVDSAGELFIGTGGGLVRKVDTNGKITTIGAILGGITSLVRDRDGNVFVSTGYGDYVYKISGYEPSTTPGNATVSIDAPDPGDDPYTRQISIGLSATGVTKFQYGWSSSSGTYPNLSYLQESTDLTNKKGTLNYLGVYSGSGTTWNGGTQPDEDWYLWVGSVSGGTLTWGTPLLVHTPKQPVWVAIGDSYSSGHYLALDEVHCITPEDTTWYSPLVSSCINVAGPSLTKNDAGLSWVSAAMASYNGANNAPSAWQLTLGPTATGGLPAYFVARSGAPSTAFGNSDFGTPGTADWASYGQSASLWSILQTRPDSWNVVSMTGGANDTNWAEKIKEWYKTNWTSLTSIAPWDVQTSIGDCPDADAVYDDLTTPDPVSGLTKDDIIRANLGGIVGVSAGLSPGTHVLNVGYPYPADSTGNQCYADSGSIKGIESVVDELNGDHTYVVGANVRDVDLAAAFGSYAVASGYISLRRLYGYPHPSATGQSLIASTANTVLTTGW